jgi:hypothetical protein
MMILERLEPLQLAIPHRRGPATNWTRQFTENRHTLTIRDGDWSSVPMDLFTCVVLEYALNYAKDVEDMRSMVSDAKERLRPGGIVVAIARAFDNGQELAERMARSGVQKLGLSNLSNREVGMLRPLIAVVFTDISVFRPNDSESEAARFDAWAVQVRKSPHRPEIRFEPEHISTRITDMGMTWVNQS